jgi:lysophospholipase L1-like esterase
LGHENHVASTEHLVNRPEGVIYCQQQRPTCLSILLQATDQQTDQNQRPCLDKCKHDGKSLKNDKQLDMIQCSFCFKWFHIECVGLRKDAKLALWPCQKCCNIINDIAEIKKKMSDTTSILNDSLTRAHKDIDNKERECREAKEEIKEAKEEIKGLKNEIQQLRTQVATLQSDIQQKTWQSFRNTKSLLIGDSLIRDIDQEKLLKTSVKHIPGAKVSDVARHLNEDVEFEGPLKNVYVCVGTNDCSDQDADLNEVAEAYEAMVTDVNSRVGSPANVIVSSIPPRKDDQGSQARVDTLNKSLQTIARRTGATFIDNERSFRLADNEINDGYLLPTDQLHLSKQGTNRLAKNLKLQMKQNSANDVTKTHKQGNSKPKSTPQRRQRDDRHRQDHFTMQDDPPRQSSITQTSRPMVYQRIPRERVHNHADDEAMYHQVSRQRHMSQESRRCRYCAEYNHDASSCGFRKPAVC